MKIRGSMNRNFAQTCLVILALTATTQICAGTSRMDNEFFAIRLAPMLAVKDGASWKKDNSAQMGVKGGKFALNLDGVIWAPAVCRQAFAAALPKAEGGLVPLVKMPIRTPEGDSGQTLVLKDKGCDVAVWLTSPKAAEALTFKRYPGLAGVPIPGTPSVIFGVMEFRLGQNRKIVEFVIGAADV